jgi:hypothetical protein
MKIRVRCWYGIYALLLSGSNFIALAGLLSLGGRLLGLILLGMRGLLMGDYDV